jgi:glycosyltransferase involved in cell wall biosynthesis
MKFSIITITYNSANTIQHTIESFLEQDWPEKEMILIDGSSKDGTLDIIKKYNSNYIHMTSEPDQGIYYALNKGLDLITGDVFGILHSDDTFNNKNSMSQIASALKTWEMVQGSIQYVDDHKTKKCRRFWRAEPRPTKGFKTGWMPSHTGFFMRKNILTEVGKFDTRYSISSDYDWMIRAVESKPDSLGTIHDVIVDMQIGGRSTKNLCSYIKHNIQCLKIRQRLLGSGFIDYALICKPLRKLRQFRYH